MIKSNEWNIIFNVHEMIICSVQTTQSYNRIFSLRYIRAHFYEKFAVKGTEENSVLFTVMNTNERNGISDSWHTSVA